MRTGKVHYIGVSNVLGWQLQKIVDLNKKFGYPQIVSLQVTINVCVVLESFGMKAYLLSVVLEGFVGSDCTSVRYIREFYNIVGTIQFTMQRDRVGIGTGLPTGEHIHVAMEPSKRVNTLATLTYHYSQSYYTGDC